jgi:hypothetical protein
MDKLAAAWLWIGDRFRRRPIAVVGFLLGAVIFAGATSYILVQQNHNASRIEKVQDVLCGGKEKVITKKVQANCQRLLDRLLEHPTQEQADRLKQIIKENP